MVESLRDILPKGVTSTTRRYSPTASVIGVRPEQIAHGALMGHFLYPIKGSDVIERVNAGRQSAVQTEDLVVDQSGERKVIKEVGKIFPDICVAILAQALVVEAVDLGNLS